MHVSWHLTHFCASRRAAERLAAEIPVSGNGSPRSGKPAQRKETADAGTANCEGIPNGTVRRRGGNIRLAAGKATQTRRRLQAGPIRAVATLAVVVGVTACVGTGVPVGGPPRGKRRRHRRRTGRHRRSPVGRRSLRPRGTARRFWGPVRRRTDRHPAGRRTAPRPHRPPRRAHRSHRGVVVFAEESRPAVRAAAPRWAVRPGPRRRPWRLPGERPACEELAGAGSRAPPTV